MLWDPKTVVTLSSLMPCRKRSKALLFVCQNWFSFLQTGAGNAHDQVSTGAEEVFLFLLKVSYGYDWFPKSVLVFCFLWGHVNWPLIHKGCLLPSVTLTQVEHS